MFFLLDSLFLLIFFSLKLYSCVDRHFLFQETGTKLEKYIKRDDLQNITSSFGRRNLNFNLISNFFSSIKSPKFIKQALVSLLIGTTMLFIKIAFTYRFFLSNFLYVKIFNKNIDIASILSNNFIFYKVLYYILSLFLYYYVSWKIYTYLESKKNIKEEKVEGTELKIGKSTDNKQVSIKENGIYQNILITGSIGSGKTSSVITNLLDELISKNIYGVIIDIKGNYINTVNKVARKYGKLDKVCKISLDSDVCYNPLDINNSSSIEIANKMKKVLNIISEKNISDSFWLDKAESYIRDFITIIKIYNGYVDFSKLHKIVTNYEYLEEKLEQVKEIILNNKLDDFTLFNVNSAINNIKNEYLRLDDRTINIIRAEITRITDIFVSDYKIFDTFCGRNSFTDFYNKITVLSINYGENKKLAQIISTYLKLDFQSQVLSKKENFIPMFFICDEFQEYANLEDANFFSLSREFKCISILSIQSYSSLLNRLKDKNSVNVILQNIVNKIWLRNDDNYTISEIIKQLGKTEKELTGVSFSENNQNVRYSLFSNKFKNFKTGLSKTYSINKRIDYKYTEEYFSTYLKNFECACMLSDGDKMYFYDKVILKRWEG